MAKYIKQEMPNLNGTEEPQVYYRLKTNRNIDSKEFAKYISRNGSGTDRAEMESAIIRIAGGLAELLGNGYSVTIDGVGTFKAGLGLKEGKEMDMFDGTETKRNARSLQLTHVNFRADKKLIAEANRRCKLERAGESRLHRLRRARFRTGRFHSGTDPEPRRQTRCYRCRQDRHLGLGCYACDGLCGNDGAFTMCCQ